MDSTQVVLNTLLVVGFLVITVCIAYATYYLVKALKSITDLADSLKTLAAIPALLVALVGKVIKKKRG